MYTENNIFTDSTVNALMDRIYYEIGQALPAVDLSSAICLTGRAAAILQGATVQPCDNIVLLTSSNAIFDFAGSGLPKKIGSPKTVRFTGRIIFYFDALVVELWYQPGLIKIVTASGIKTQDIFEINEILL